MSAAHSGEGGRDREPIAARAAVSMCFHWCQVYAQFLTDFGAHRVLKLEMEVRTSSSPY